MLDCGAPFAATGVTVEPFNNTKFGSLITFHCDGSNITATAICDNTGEWDPNPASFNCGDDSLGIEILSSYSNLSHIPDPASLECELIVGTAGTVGLLQ